VVRDVFGWDAILKGVKFFVENFMFLGEGGQMEWKVNFLVWGYLVDSVAQ
jgi:hypothetical protein